MKPIYHKSWKPQFGDPVKPLGVKPKQKPKSKRRTIRKGSWSNPSQKMIDGELSKCRISKVNIETGEIIESREATNALKPKLYGKTGRIANYRRK